jgi:methylmalonyl-CoA mutase N-terminal domain/subunit
LAALRASRDSKAVNEALDKLVSVSREGGNLMPHILHAVEQYATLGEIADAFRSVFGEYQGS